MNSDEFHHIERTRDGRFPHDMAIVLPGQYFASRDPMIVYTVLGSCVAACIRDPVTHVGGLNHFVLPESTGAHHTSDSGRYGCFAMASLLEALARYGAVRERLEVKLFGGGHLAQEMTDVGQHNITWIRRYCRQAHFTPVATDLGGEMARCLYYFTATGRVLVRRIPLEPRPYPPGRRGLDADVPTTNDDAVWSSGEAT